MPLKAFLCTTILLILTITLLYTQNGPYVKDCKYFTTKCQGIFRSTVWTNTIKKSKSSYETKQDFFYHWELSRLISWFLLKKQLY